MSPIDRLRAAATALRTGSVPLALHHLLIFASDPTDRVENLQVLRAAYLLAVACDQAQAGRAKRVAVLLDQAEEVLRVLQLPGRIFGRLRRI